MSRGRRQSRTHNLFQNLEGQLYAVHVDRLLLEIARQGCITAGIRLGDTLRHSHCLWDDRQNGNRTLRSTLGAPVVEVADALVPEPAEPVARKSELLTLLRCNR